MYVLRSEILRYTQLQRLWDKVSICIANIHKKNQLSILKSSCEIHVSNGQTDILTTNKVIAYKILFSNVKV